MYLARRGVKDAVSEPLNGFIFSFLFFVMNILRSIKSIGSGLIFTIEKELLSNDIYTSYTGYYKNKECTIFKYKNNYSKIVEESYPLLKYVQDVLHITPEVLAYQKYNSYFYIVTSKILPLATQEEIVGKTCKYKLFNEFVSTNISIINNTLIAKHSIVLSSVKNICASSKSKEATANPESELTYGTPHHSSSGHRTGTVSGNCLVYTDEKEKKGIDYCDIYYDGNNNTRAMIFAVFSDKNTIPNIPNIIHTLHNLLGTDKYDEIYNILLYNSESLPEYYAKYVLGILLAYIETNQIKLKEIEEIISKHNINASSTAKKSNANLYYIIHSIPLFTLSVLKNSISDYTSSTVLYILLYFINSFLFELSIAEVNTLFGHIHKNISKFKKVKQKVTEISFNGLNVLSSSNKALFIQFLMKECLGTDLSGPIKNNLNVLIEIDGIFSLLIFLLTTHSIQNYRLGMYFVYNKVDRIEVEGLLEIVSLLSKRCLEEETAKETVSLLKFIIEYVEKNLHEIKNSKWQLLKTRKIKNQKKSKAADKESEWKRKNIEHTESKKNMIESVKGTCKEKKIHKSIETNNNDKTWENEDW